MSSPAEGNNPSDPDEPEGAGEREQAALPPPLSERLVFGAHWGLLAFFIGVASYHLLGMVVSLLVAGRVAGPNALAAGEFGPLLLLVFLPTLALGAGPLLGSWWWGRGPRLDFGLLPRGRDLRVGLACGGLALLAAYVVSFVLSLFYGAEQLSDVALNELTERFDSRIWLGIAVVIIVFAAPLAEELLVRGSLWSALSHYRVPGWAVLVLTAVVFAYLHADPLRTPALFAQGLAIGAARMITGKVGPSVVAHATNNSLPALVILVEAW